MEKHLEYIENVENIISRIKADGKVDIEKAADAFSSAIINNQNIFLFGTGHSHMLAEELFYRAGGLVNIRPILETALMLNESASKSTKLERLEGYAEILFEQYGMKRGDTIVIISNSGRNGVIVDMALICKNAGLTVIALTNMEHTRSGESRHKSGKKLFELADIVLDNYGCKGDASVEMDGLDGKVCPTSTVAGALILNAVVACALEKCASRGVYPDCFLSSNVDGGDEKNERLLEKYKGEVRHL